MDHVAESDYTGDLCEGLDVYAPGRGADYDINKDEKLPARLVLLLPCEVILHFLTGKHTILSAPLPDEKVWQWQQRVLPSDIHMIYGLSTCHLQLIQGKMVNTYANREQLACEAVDARKPMYAINWTFGGPGGVILMLGNASESPRVDYQSLDDDCVICMEPLSHPFSYNNELCRLRCGHIFHYTCARDAAAVTGTCSLCRQFIKRAGTK